MEGLEKEKLYDSTTGELVEVIVSPNGKSFHIEGFSWDFIQNAKKSLNNTVKKSHKKNPVSIIEIKNAPHSKRVNKPEDQKIR